MNIWRVPYPKFGAGPGLERTTRVAHELGVELSAFGKRGVVIVGSNGKGSTAAMCASLLSQSAGEVGLFTSPHLFALNERFRVGAEEISDEELRMHWDRVQGAIEASGFQHQIGGFEFLFLIAADWFAARGCTHTVWEAGIGGRLDPVKLIHAERVALTALDFEHTALLGDTLEAIALEKIAAAPAGARLFVAADIASRDAVERYGIEHKLQTTFVAPLPGDVSLAGAHQRSNAALAIALARDVAELSDEQVARGLAQTWWPGRLEILSERPRVVIDVGHTPDGVTQALQGFRGLSGDRSAVLVCGVSQDKDVGAIMERLAPAFADIICVAAHHKGAPAALIAAHAQRANSKAEITLAESITDAYRMAIAKPQGRAIYVAGGLFVAAEFKAVHLGRDPASLAFF